MLTTTQKKKYFISFSKNSTEKKKNWEDYIIKYKENKKDSLSLEIVNMEFKLCIFL